MYSAAVNNGAVPYWYIVAYANRSFLISAMKNSTVLDIYFIAYAYGVYIAAHNGGKPNAAVIPHFHVSNNSAVLC